MKPRLPPLNALRTFLVAGRHASFADAAEVLAVTPGAVSRQVRVLEDWLGVPLFRRQHKRVSLTALGQRYLDTVSGPLDEISAATDRIRRPDTARPLAICCYPTFALRWLVPRWGRFYDLHPDIDVQLTTSLSAVDFTRDDFDAAIQVGRDLGRDPAVVALPLVEVDLIPVCAPALREGLRPLERPQDLARHTLLHGAPRPDDWRRWLTFAGVTGVDPTSGLTFDSLNLSIQAAIGGIGVAIAVRALVEDDLAAGRLLQPFGPMRQSGRPFHLVWPAHRGRDPRLAAFVAWLKEEAAGPSNQAASPDR